MGFSVIIKYKHRCIHKLFTNIITFLKKIITNPLVVLLVLVSVLGIFIFYINDISFPNLFQYIFTTINCDPLDDEFKDHLIILQSFHGKLMVPLNGYDIVDKDVFLDMFNNKSGALGISQCSNGISKLNPKEPVVYIIEVKNKIYTVHPYLVDLIFEMFGIND